MLETLISSKTRIKLLMRLFLNPESTAHLRGLAEEFEESTNAVRLELNRFEEAGMLTSESQGNKKLYKANHTHPLFQEINSILLKYIGADKIIESIISRMGNLEELFLTGDYARGKDSGIVDLVLVGDVNKAFLVDKVAKAETMIGKKVRYLVYSSNEWQDLRQTQSYNPYILLWQRSSTK